MRYCEVQDVELRVGDLAPSRTFGNETHPTKAEVDALIDGVTGQMNSTLQARGYTAPIVEATYPHAYAWARSAASAGVSARVILTYPTAAFDPDDEFNPMATRAKGLWAEFAAFLKAVDSGLLYAARSGGGMAMMKVGSYQHTDGSYPLPIFTRPMWDYPGSGETRFE